MHIAALRDRYMRRHHRFRHELAYGDLNNHCFEWGERVSSLMNKQFAPFVSRVVGTPVKATRPLVHWYTPTSTLGIHIDGTDYPVSMSVLLHQHGEPSPLGLLSREISHPTGRVYAPLSVGDAVIFSGQQLPHFRQHLSESQYVLSLSLSFAHAN
eukprot:TRINITY_DN525_c2_g1_i1.p1 TRINITY_DN525_c2_g1~~TRINITY_DN525_c2_g1_i1.p1  ORF type:complete len:155 (-),score=25.57 TRINITY_DN525_c2_g1_i1:312-776(-)